MSKITDFLCGSGLDSNSMNIYEVIAKDNDWWEGCHNHIQWVFPLQEPSQFNPEAPLLTDEDITYVKSRAMVIWNVRKSYCRFLSFLGLKTNADFRIVPDESFIDRADVWLYFNHNWLRITRVLKCLRSFGLYREAARFMDCLTDISNLFSIPADTVEFWAEASEYRKVGA